MRGPLPEQTRILGHMNAQHRDSLALFLQHHHNLAGVCARHATLTAVTLDDMTILAPLDGALGRGLCLLPAQMIPAAWWREYVVPVGVPASSPITLSSSSDGSNKTSSSSFSSSSSSAAAVKVTQGMASYAEARTAFKFMDERARAALGCSSTTITTYTPPDRWLHWTFLVLTVGTLALFSRRAHFTSTGCTAFDYDLMREESAVAAWLDVGLTLAIETSLALLPPSLRSRLLHIPTPVTVPIRRAQLHAVALHWTSQFKSFCLAIRPALLVFMVAIHGSEAYWLARTRLRRHVVLQGSWLWWVWVLDAFAEGMGAFARFDRLVVAKEKKKL